MMLNRRYVLDRLRLGPRWYPVEQHFCERPYMVCQSRCHRRGTRPPHLRCATAVLAWNTQLTASGSEEARALLRGLQGFPDNLPRLASLRPPDGNTRPEAIVDSYDTKHSVENSPSRTDRRGGER